MPNREPRHPCELIISIKARSGRIRRTDVGGGGGGGGVEDIYSQHKLSTRLESNAYYTHSRAPRLMIYFNLFGKLKTTLRRTHQMQRITRENAKNDFSAAAAVEWTKRKADGLQARRSQ